MNSLKFTTSNNLWKRPCIVLRLYKFCCKFDLFHSFSFRCVYARSPTHLKQVCLVLRYKGNYSASVIIMGSWVKIECDFFYHTWKSRDYNTFHDEFSLLNYHTIAVNLVSTLIFLPCQLQINYKGVDYNPSKNVRNKTKN